MHVLGVEGMFIMELGSVNQWSQKMIDKIMIPNSRLVFVDHKHLALLVYAVDDILLGA
jgi:hypothetical protein